ncbi:MAG: Xaa-Pro peptidase family protein [Pseudomonadota bacterium]
MAALDTSFSARPKIDPTRRRSRSAPRQIEVPDTPDTPGNPAHREWALAGLEAPDLDVIRAYRLERIREQLRTRDFGGAILTDPLNVRYATDTSNMQVWCLHNPVRYAYVATEGPVIVFDFHACEHLSDHLPLVTESRPATAWFYFESGDEEQHHAEHWAEEIVGLVSQFGGGNSRIAIDKCDPIGLAHLERLGLECTVSQAFTEHARRIKHAEELKAMQRSINTTEVAMAEMWHTLQRHYPHGLPLTENQIWAILHKVNIERGGEWIETRLLASGPRTNPWFHESSDRIMQVGEMLAFDTDLVGPYGYCADVSRSWVIPDNAPTDEQTALIDLAIEQVAFNRDLLRPGITHRELTEKSFQLPPDCINGRYGVVIHGVGLCDEYPSIRYREDWDHCGYDGVIEEGQCLCVESYVGRDGGAEGVKIEVQGVVTETGFEVFDRFPLDLVPDIPDDPGAIGTLPPVL